MEEGNKMTALRDAFGLCTDKFWSKTKKRRKINKKNKNLENREMGSKRKK